MYLHIICITPSVFLLYFHSLVLYECSYLNGIQFHYMNKYDIIKNNKLGITCNHILTCILPHHHDLN